jgi:hypothetical protein
LDHVLILGEGHLERVLDEYRVYFNGGRPHQGIAQRPPAAFGSPMPPAIATDPTSIIARPVLGGLHHDYRAAA